MDGSDYRLALMLQQQFDHEANIDNPRQDIVYAKKKPNHNTSKSLTDPSWELIDPTPDIHILFLAFNGKYFWDKLLSVCVSWSKRMTSCAGICRYQGRSGMCEITLSEPLLKLRPRKDLIETLLHEMIHAYLFVTHNNRDRDGHGPEFHKHMYRINAEAGTSITVYHSFYDEVKLYKQHWWCCNGPCRKLQPYFGMVKRAMNRAPGPNDFWWQQHQQTCGGQYIKVKEPEKPKQNKNKNLGVDIRKIIPSLKNKNSDGSASTIRGTGNLIKKTKSKNTMSNASSTIVVNKKPSTNKKLVSPNKTPLVQTKLHYASTFTGKGEVLGSITDTTKDYSVVRNHWINKYPSTITKLPSSSDYSNFERSPKRIKVHSNIECPICKKSLPEAEINVHVDKCSQNQSNISNCPTCDKQINVSELEEHMQTCITEIFDSSEDFSVEHEELIPCLVCNKTVVKSRLNEHLDDCMSDNIFNNSNTNFTVTEDPEESTNEKTVEKLYDCPVCFGQFSFNEMSAHIDQCLLNDGSASEGSLSNSFLDDLNGD